MTAKCPLHSSLFALLVAVFPPTAAWGQAYPGKAVRIIVPAGTGGPDTVARIVGAQLTQRMGQPFVVENRPGANGIVGADVVAKSAPDGYTLMVYSSGFVVNQHVYKKLPYDTEKDFIPVTNLVDNGGLFFAVHPSLPVQTLQELIALARKPDSKLSYSTPGVANPWHVAMELFNVLAGTKMAHIPYKGGGPATAALVAGEVQVMFSSPAPILPFAKSGKVRVLAYTAPKRAASLPNVPTIAEAGLPSYQMDGGWFGMFAPAKTSPEIVERLYRETRASMMDPPILAKIRGLGVEPIGNTPAEFRQFFNAEVRRYAEWVRVTRIEAE